MVEQKSIPYVDIADIQETFVDGLHVLNFEKMLFRLELTVNRCLRVNDGQPDGVARYTAARLIMPGETMIALHTALTNVIASLESQGVIKRGNIVVPPVGKPN